jgi:hypothetical protein
MTRLTNAEKHTIRSKVMGDLPAYPDPRPTIQKLLDDHVADTAPAKVAAVLRDKQLRSYLKETYVYFGGLGSFHVVGGQDDRDQLQSWANLNEEIGKLVKGYAENQEQRTKVDRELRQGLEAVNTDKAFLEQYPTLAKYLPQRDKPAETLPVATNLLATLKEAGLELDEAA